MTSKSTIFSIWENKIDKIIQNKPQNTVEN